MFRSRLLAIVLVLATLPAIARAESLMDRATTLQATFDDILDRIDACGSEGACSDASNILRDLRDADADLATLHADRTALGTCATCADLDALIAHLDDLDDDATSLTQTWDETAAREAPSAPDDEPQRDASGEVPGQS